MFEKAMLTQGKTRRPLGVVLGMAGELTALGVVVLVPIVYTDKLPPLLFATTPIAVPSRAPEPPPPELVKAARQRGTPVVPVHSDWVFRAPARIPEKVADLIEEPVVVASGPWVPGSTGPSIPGIQGLPITSGPAVAPPPERPAERTKAAAAEKLPDRIRVGGLVQAARLVSRVIPTYPALAKQAHVQGTVTLVAVIGCDGTVRSLRVMSGHPLLVRAALDAVSKWVYRPTLLNGEPVEVDTEIDVIFSLAQ